MTVQCPPGRYHGIKCHLINRFLDLSLYRLSGTTRPGYRVSTGFRTLLNGFTSAKATTYRSPSWDT